MKNYFILAILVFYSQAVHAAGFVESRIKNLIQQVDNPISIELNRVPEGSLVRAVWLDIPIYIYHRNKQDIELLSKIDNNKLADPDDKNIEEAIIDRYSTSVAGVYAQLFKKGIEVVQNNEFRSNNKSFLITSGIDPYSSCTLIYEAHGKVKFYDPCSSRIYDAAGRLFIKTKDGKKVTKPYFNLRVLPTFMEGKNKVFFGVKEGYASLPKVEYNYSLKYKKQTPSQQLVTAALYNDYETLEKALEKGADIEYQGDNLPPPLIAAIFGSDIKSIEFLISKGAKITEGALKQGKLQKRDDVSAIFLKEALIKDEKHFKNPAPSISDSSNE